MRKSVFIRSVLRQPARTLLLALLMIVASFAFVARVVEYVIVTRELDRIADSYQSIGFLAPINPQNISFDRDVTEAAAIVRYSPLVNFVDERVFVQGILQDRINTTGRLAGITATSFLPAVEDIGIIALEFYFYATVRINQHSPQIVRGDDFDFINLILEVGEIIVGDAGGMGLLARQIYTIGGRRVQVTNRLDVRIPLSPDESDRFRGGDRYPFNFMPLTEYLFRATQVPGRHGYITWYARPLIGQDGLEFQANSLSLNLDARDTEGLVFTANTRNEEEMTYVYSRIQEDIDLAHDNLSSMMVIGTMGMEMMPRFQDPLSGRLLDTTPLMTGGRFINHEDYLNANPVAVVPVQMATRRGLRVGEEFTITLRQNPRPSWIDQDTESWWAMGGEAWWMPQPQGWWAVTEYAESWQNLPTYELTLTVVGVYWNTPIGMLNHNFLNKEMYIPSSVMPEGFGWTDAPHLAGMHSFVMHTPRYEARFIANYGEQLRVLGFAPRFLESGFADFAAAADPIITSITINLTMFTILSVFILLLVVFLYLRQWLKTVAISRALGSPSSKTLRQLVTPILIFWLPAIAIGSVLAWFFAISQASASLEAFALTMGILDYVADYYDIVGAPIVSWFLLLAIVLTLIAFGEMMNAVAAWRKNAANLPGSSSSMRKLWSEVSMPIFPLRTPFIIIGAAYTWFLAIDAMDIRFFELIDGLIVQAGADSLEMYWLVALGSSIAVVALIILITSGIIIVRRPVLAQLQGGTVQKRRKLKKSKVIVPEVAPAHFVASNFNVSLKPLKKRRLAATKAGFRHTSRHILRSPLRSGLVVVIITGFVLSLGWLNHTIIFTENEIERLWEETVVSADLIRSPDDERVLFGWQEFYGQASISRASANHLLNSGFVDDYYAELLWVHGFVRSEEDFADFATPGEGWWLTSDLVFAVNSLDGFVYENTRGVMDEALGVIGDDVEIHFAEGFGAEDFVFYGFHDEDGYIIPVPILVRQSFLYEHGYYLGQHLVLETPRTHVQIIGTFEGGLSRGVNRFGTWRSAIIMPIDAMLPHYTINIWRAGRLLSAVATYTTVRINIDTTRNREITLLNELMTDVLPRNNISQIGNIPLELFVHDSQLRNAVEPMEQNLRLLQLLYPIAIGVAALLSVGLSLMIMLQNAKNAAIMRVLGKPKAKSQISLCGEQLLLSLLGTLLGLLTLQLLGVNALANAPLIFAAMCFTGAALGATTGSVAISTRPPIDLLQVRE
ncbi:MAG: hypothetical protein FWB74_06595 [Defluviitaleaceae bacterium]|nr:hypothetical protein [Defluviitaleaceae bacterium]